MNCGGGSEIDSELHQYTCQYCGAILAIGNSSSESSTEKRVINPEDELRLVAINQVEDQYFHGAKRFEDVMLAYDEVESAMDGHADYWLRKARFFAKGNLKEFTEGRISAGRRSAVVDRYVFLMDKAISLYSGNVLPLKMEKEKTIGEVNNAFEGRKRKAEERMKANLEAKKQEEARAKAAELAKSDRDQRLAEAREKANMAAVVEELDQAAAKKRRRNIIIAVVGVVAAFIAILFLRACGGREEEVDVSDYEEFLELSYAMDLLNNDRTRFDILDLDINFGDQTREDSGALRVVAPAVADLDTITFHFDQDDVLTRILIGGANYFNSHAASFGLDNSIADGFDATSVEIDDNVLSFVIGEYNISITERSERFNIDISHIDDELTAEQRAMWDLIEARIEDGYSSWGELIIWAEENDVPFSAREDEEPPIEAVSQLIDRYGLVGDYLAATPGIGSDDDPEEVLLLLHFENLTYNDTIAELYNLNRNSGRELNIWLDNGGRDRLEYHFETVEILSFDDSGQLITEQPSAVEFISWNVEFTDWFTPAGEGLVRIESVYQILDIDDDEDDEDEDDDDEDDGVTNLSPGVWTVGDDIPEGRYEIMGDSGGTFIVWRRDAMLVNEALGGDGIGALTIYLLNGDVIDISDINNVSFNLVENRAFLTNLSAGVWVVGSDIIPGQFYATVPTGTGHIAVWRGEDLLVNEAITDDGVGVWVDLEEGDMITISGVNLVVFE